MMPSADATFQIGQRIRSSDAGAFKGTIRYIGPVSGQQGEWIGIEWDDSERGKHDGETGGVKYFTVKQAGAGSFVRSHKIEAGVAFVQALKARYKPEGDLQQVEGQSWQRSPTSKEPPLKPLCLHSSISSCSSESHCPSTAST
jgi:hypothetical protein